MSHRTLLATGVVTALALVIGCQSKEDSTPKTATTPVSASASKFRLAAEPAGAKEVMDARKSTKDGDEVTLVGRIGGEEKPFVDGLAAFMIADTHLKPCGGPGDACPTPWDYCCETNLSGATATVKVVDAQGKPVAEDARQLLGVKELSTVVVHGKVQRDDKGNLVVLADGVFVRS